MGDIGPKLGYFGMDNGFLRLNNVRIPRDQMLMRYSKVSRVTTIVVTLWYLRERERERERERTITNQTLANIVV